MQVFKADSAEERYVMAVYALITLRIAADQLLSALLPSAAIRLFELLCLGLILWCCLKVCFLNAHFKYRGWCLVLIALLAINNLFIIARGGYSGGIKDLVLDKLDVNGLPAYLLPFIILVLPNRKYFKSILKVFFYSTLLILPIWLINALDLVQDEFYGEAIGAYLPFYGIILLQFRKRFTVKEQVAMIAIYLAYLLIMVLNARRNMVLSLTLYLVLAFFISNYSAIKRSMRARIVFIAGAAALIVITVFSWGTLSSTIFNRLLDRGLEDSRSQVEMYLFMDLSTSPASDWVFGRGMDGTYYQITQNQETYEVTSERENVETGYLNMLLKGGLIYVLLVVIILFTAFIKGVSFKKPLLTGMSIVLLLYLLDMYMTNPISFFAVRTVVFWFIISICFQLPNPGDYRKILHSNAL